MLYHTLITVQCAQSITFKWIAQEKSFLPYLIFTDGSGAFLPHGTDIIIVHNLTLWIHQMFTMTYKSGHKSLKPSSNDHFTIKNKFFGTFSV